jgi:hypothetical protein
LIRKDDKKADFSTEKLILNSGWFLRVFVFYFFSKP